MLHTLGLVNYLFFFFFLNILLDYSRSLNMAIFFGKFILDCPTKILIHAWKLQHLKLVAAPPPLNGR